MEFRRGEKKGNHQHGSPLVEQTRVNDRIDTQASKQIARNEKMDNNPGCKIDLRKINFTEKNLPKASKNIEIELTTRAERDQLDK